MIAIREITPDDNKAVAALIRSVFDELAIPKTGTAYEDAALDCMFENYNVAKAVYYVVDLDGEIIGGAGVAHLEGALDEVCELQKMYFLEKARGKGVGAQIMQQCLDAATKFGFTQCYLETMPFMHAAQKLYKKFNFEYLEAPMGCTGHTSCPVWMLKKL